MTTGRFNQYWRQTTESLVSQFNSALSGLTSDEARRRLEQSGPNTLKVSHRDTPVMLFLRQFKSPIIIILLFATIVSALLGDWVDAVIIAVIVIGSALLSFFQEYSASNATQMLMQQVQVTATVIRDGQEHSVPAEEIVPGDVVVLSAGSLVPADGILLQANDLYVNQAVLTGETFPVEKKPGPVTLDGLADRTNTVFMGTNVRSGSGQALIVQTGKGTAFGQIAEKLTLRAPETEFERGIRRLGNLLTEVMLVLVFVIFALNVYFQKPVLDSLLFSVALAVGLTPQLLPAIININLAKGSQKMAKAGVIVRRLNAIENFGSMDVLCTDKTGTLTQGVVQLDDTPDVNGQTSGQVLRYAYINAYFQTGLTNPLDEAILRHAKIDISGCTKDGEVPYDFIRKRLTVVIREGNDRLMITKGALENVLAVCSHVQVGGTTEPLMDTLEEQLEQQYASWSGQGFRVLGVAVKSVLSEERDITRGDEQEMVFGGFLLFLDPPKPDAEATIRALNELGVQLKIITGDNRLVAKYVAEAIGMPVERTLTGAEIALMHDEALWHSAEDTTLFTEIEPNQKERIILALRKMQHVVGYMGDGINDAPALHAADVGVSVDTAVDVAKDAADFVLLEHSLDVLRQGILLGRTTFANTLKYVFMATSANFGNMFSVAGVSLFLPFLPLLPKQILLLNFLTDMPELTIANDNVDEQSVRHPRRWNIGFIRRFMFTFGTLSSAFDYLTFAVLLLLLSTDAEQFRTAWFIESILSATLVVFVLRTPLPFHRSTPSRAMLVATALVCLVAVTIPYSPLAGVLGFQPLSPLYVLVMLAISVMYLIATEITKAWFYHRVPAA